MEEINLRGHHLSNLANYYFTGNLNEEEYLDDDGNLVYGEEFIERNYDLFDEIIIGEIKSIRLIDDLDKICSLSCENKGSSCYSERLKNADREEIEAYGYVLGEKVNSSELLDNLCLFWEITGYMTYWYYKNRREHQAIERVIEGNF